MVRRNLLSPKYRADFRIAARVFLQHQQRWVIRALVRQFHFGLASRGWHRDQSAADDKLSMARSRPTDIDSRAAYRVHVPCESAWLGNECYGGSKWEIGIGC